MLGRRNKVQLIAFVLATLVGVSYAAVEYVQVPRMLGIGIDRVTLDLPRAGGLYENALVTYRGNEVGKVERVELSPTGVRAVLGIEEGSSVPADANVSIRSMSAIGEQYVNFEPRSGGAPLEHGQVIPGERVSYPTPTGELLSSVNNLAGTLPLDKLDSTVDELYTAIGGAGDDLSRLLRSAAELQNQADANLGPTTKLLRDLVPVLATQQRIGPEVRSFTGDLAATTDTLQAIDPSIRGTVDKGQPLVDEVQGLLNDVRPTLPQLLTDMTSTGQVLRVYHAAMQHTLVVLPAAVASLTSTTAKGVQDSGGQSPPPTSAMGFKLTFNKPPPCVEGFQPDRVPPSDLSNSTPPPKDAYCKEPKDSPIGVRGARNVPCPPGSPAGRESTGATAAECGLHFQSPNEADAATDAAIEHMMEVAARNPKTREENEAFIGDNDFPIEDPVGPPPSIHGRGDGSNQDKGLPGQQPDGSFLVDGQPFLNGDPLPLPEITGPDGQPVTGLQDFVLGPLLTPA